MKRACYQAGCGNAESVLVTDDSGTAVEISGFAVGELSGVEVSEPSFDAKTGHTFSVTPDPALVGEDEHELELTGTDPETGDDWRDVIVFQVVDSIESV